MVDLIIWVPLKLVAAAYEFINYYVEGINLETFKTLKKEIMGKKPVMFIVEDDPTFNKLLTAYFTSKLNWEVHSFTEGEESLNKLYLNPVVWLQDFDLPGINGIEVMKRAKKQLPDTGFIFLSGQGNIKVAVESLKEGAFDYIVKDASSKENALNKVDQVMRIKKLEDNRKASRIGLVVMGVILLISWIIFLFVK